MAIKSQLFAPKMEPSSSEPCGRFSLITLKKAHARNTVMIFSRPLNLSLTPESFLPKKMATLALITHNY